MQKIYPDLLAHRLNFDAIVFFGCTLKELQIIASLSLVVCIILLGTLMRCLLHLFMLGVGLAFPAALGLTALIALTFQKFKHGKPKGYIKQRFLLALEHYGLYKTPFIRRSGAWSLGRRL
jgi:conjugative transfer region protein (TIGR03750 family)